MADNSDNSGQDNSDDRDGLEKIGDAFSNSFKNLAKKAAPPKTETEGNFFRAVKANRVQEVSKILDAGFDPNTYDGSGKTALHIAAVNNGVDVARLLIERGANPRLVVKDSPGHTPLVDAVNYGKPEMVELLARHGGYTPGVMVGGFTPLHRACEKGKAAMVEALLNAGASSSELTENGSTPLLIAVQGRHAKVVDVLLKFSSAAATINQCSNKTDREKRTAFHLAVSRGQSEVISAMLEKGAEVNVKDVEGLTPLFYAIDRSKTDLVRKLVEAGSDLNRTYGVHGTPLSYVCTTKTINDKTRVELIDLLIRMGADTDIPSPEGQPPLHAALSTGCSDDVLAALLSYPVNKDIFDKAGCTPLMYAKSPEQTRQLLAAGANPDARNGIDAGTPLIQAVKNSDKEAVRVLLEAGAHPALYDGYGRSALSYARELEKAGIAEAMSQREIIKALEQALTKRTAPKSASPSL